MSKFAYLYTEPENIHQVTGSTPYGTYDADHQFQSESLNLEEVEKLVKPYADAKIKEKFGEDYEIFDYYDTLNLSWNVEIDAISKITDYRKKDVKKLKLPELKKI